MTKFNELLQLLHRGKSPYDGFPTAQWSGTWYNDPGAQRDILKRSLDKCVPHSITTDQGIVVVEVGSFVGESAIFMAKHLKSKGADAVILCVDTWLGGVDHHLRAPEKMTTHFGRFDLYYKFLANVIEHGCQDMILPLTLDSVNAARLLAARGVRADFAYIDASHEEGDVLRDYEAYWPLVRSGGVFLVDDVSNHFPGVVKDWERFWKINSIEPETWDVSGEKIAVVKP